MLINKSVKEFVEATASSEPVPGGGSVAALAASIAAALGEMVANLTIGKKKYAEVEEEMKVISEKMNSCRQVLLEYIDKDAESFDVVMKAYGMAKETDDEKAARSAAIQEAMKDAAAVPLAVAKSTFDLMAPIKAVVLKGNSNAVTDGAVAAMMARTAVLGALYNVKINLASIKDEDFVSKVTADVIRLETEVVQIEQEILAAVVI